MISTVPLYFYVEEDMLAGRAIWLSSGHHPGVVMPNLCASFGFQVPLLRWAAVVTPSHDKARAN